MEQFKVLGQTMYINSENGDFAINPEELRNGPLRQISSAPPYSPTWAIRLYHVTKVTTRLQIKLFCDNSLAFLCTHINFFERRHGYE